MEARAVVVPEETFLESLHLDREQMSDFHNSEGHFLYLRQKSGTDATAYNLEVRRGPESCHFCFVRDGSAITFFVIL